MSELAEYLEIGKSSPVPDRSAATTSVARLVPSPTESPDAGAQATALQHAIRYAQMGWPVFPCSPATKKPLTLHGFKDATTNQETIQAWWRSHPDAMIGVPTGQRSGFFVLDIDCDPESGKDGFASIRAMGILPKTAHARTPRGGLHVLYRWDPERPIGSSAGRIGLGLDIRGEGGYIIAAGSVRADGRVYEWLASPDAAGIADAPVWLLDAIGSDQRPTPDGWTAAGGEAEPNEAYLDDDDAQTAAVRYLAVAEPAIEGRGGRSHTLTVLQRCGDFGCRAEMAIQLMTADDGWSDRCSPPWDADELEDHVRGLKRDRPLGCEHPTVVARGLAAEWWEPVPNDADPSARQTNARPSRLKFHGDPDDAPLKEWLLDKTLPKVGVALLSGQWGTYKTFVAFDLAAAVITKGSFAGRAVKRQGGVLLIAAEGQHDVRSRLAAVVREKVGPALALPMVERLPLDVDHLPFTWDEECPALTGGANAIAELRNQVRDAVDQLLARTGVPLALIVIDTMMSAAGFRDGNDSAEAQKVMNLLRKIAAEFQVLVLVVDHMGKDQTRGTLGASSKEASADAVLAMLGEKTVAGKSTNVRLAFRKIRGARQGDEVTFSTRPVNVGVDADGAPIDTLVIDWTGVSARPARSREDLWPAKLTVFRTALDRCLADGVLARPLSDGSEVRVALRDSVRDEFFANHPGQTRDAKRTAFNRNMAQAVNEGFVLTREIKIAEAVQAVVWSAHAMADAPEVTSTKAGGAEADAGNVRQTKTIEDLF